MKDLQFKVLIEQDENGVYVASVPELPGCYTQGKTIFSKTIFSLLRH